MTESVDHASGAPDRATAVRDRADGAHDQAAACSGERRAGGAEASQASAWPDAMQVWSLSASAVLSGYGPTASDFV
ncbi:hypothetical protein QR97_25905 [Streptomyces sp. PBH53]|nr:hypothetical protein QR97_25905 [Streptomyces sp. PBH53]